MTDAPDGAVSFPEGSSPDGAVLFAESGARWRAVAYGPVLCVSVLILEVTTSSPVHWFALVLGAALIAGIVTLQVMAGRRHISVELTESVLRNGTESLPLREIAKVLPASGDDYWDQRSWKDEFWEDEEWESAQALGDLSDVPRRRTGIGLRLRDGRLTQTWARDHRGLRAALETALASRSVDAEDRHDENGADL